MNYYAFRFRLPFFRSTFNSKLKMTLKQTHPTERVLNLKTKEAITLANESRWDEAVFVNRLIVESSPYDIGAYNRLGKALSEMGRYSEARDSFQNALSISPYNSIAKKNLLRLANLNLKFSFIHFG